MISVVDALLPTVILSASALITLPMINIIRRRNGRHKSLVVAWIAVPFFISALWTVKLALQYFEVMGTKPFLFVSFSSEGEAI